MAKPRVFISSTFYDLRLIRLELDKFLVSLGYESIRNEEGDIPYETKESLQNYCYKEISHADIFISIIGSRFGSSSEGNRERSISNMELTTAINQKKHVFIFIEKSVFIEYETFLLNEKNENVEYKYVDNINIYKFIKEIKSLPNNNNIKDFEEADDIISYLREQFAGLMKKFFEQEQRDHETSIIKDINYTAQTLRDLVDYLQTTNEEKKTELNEIIKTSHPIIRELKELLHIPYKFYIEEFDDLRKLLGSFKFIFLLESERNNNSYIFSKFDYENGDTEKICISKDIFDANKKLKFYRPIEWNNEFISLTREEYERLPF